MRKKAFSLLLALALCLSLLPTAALAAGTASVNVYLRTLDQEQTATPSRSNFVKIPNDQLALLGLGSRYANTDSYGNWVYYARLSSSAAADYTASVYERGSEEVSNVVAEITDSTAVKQSGISFDLPEAGSGVTWDTLSWSSDGSSSSWHLNGELHVYKVTLDLNYDGADHSSEALTRYEVVDTEISSGLPAAVPTRTDYTFAGWYTAPDGGTKITKIPKLSDDATYYAHWTEGAAHTHSVGSDEVTFEAWTSTDSLPDTAGNYYLANNVTLKTAVSSTYDYSRTMYSGWIVPDGVVLCLNGHTITLQNPALTDNEGADVDVIKVTGHFTLTDCHSDAQQGAITHAEDSSGRKYPGKGVYVVGGTFDMYGGRITGNTSEYDSGGSGVSVRGVPDENTASVFNLYGGSITENWATSGGGVQVSRIAWYGPSEFHMYGGSITNNVADSDVGSYGTGGGVYVSWTAKFVMSGGEISGNTASQYGGGVYASALARDSAYDQYGEAAKFEASGTARITGNTVGGQANNVCLSSSASNYETVSVVIAITDTLTGKIGVTTENAPSTGHAIPVATGAADGTGYDKIQTDNDSYEIQRRGSTLVLAVPGDTAGKTDAAVNLSGVPAKTVYGDSFRLTASVGSTGTGTGTWTWTSSDPAVLQVTGTNGTAEVKALKSGKATITVAYASDTAEGSAKTAEIQVDKRPLTARYDNVTITKGDALPAFTMSFTGFAAGDTKETVIDSIPDPLILSGSGPVSDDTARTTAGTYELAYFGTSPTIKTDMQDKYELSDIQSGTLTVLAPSSPGSSSGGSSTYPVSTPAKAENGSVSSNLKNASKGSTVTITVKPDAGYRLATLTVTDQKGGELTLTDKGSGVYTFTMPASKVTVNASFVKEAEASPFGDVSADAYYYEAVQWAAEQGITGGVGRDLFAPNASCTRAQTVTFLWRAAGSPEPKTSTTDFSDVPSGAYYAKAVAWALENGITTGTGDGTFSPHAACTRAQTVTFLFRAAKASVSGAPAFRDVAATAYYAEAVKWAADNGITGGIGGGLFGSDRSCTRAQIVTFLWRLYAGK